MKAIYHRANSRGHANHGWLDTHHTFSFANYHNPERMNFGVLRVLNDDVVAGGMGFGEHPHRDMEIISIPLEGKLSHGDNMGNQGIISKGEAQVMSAGTGVVHSEKNADANKPVKFLQIWIIPNRMGVEPRYDQITISKRVPNNFQQVVSPNKDDDGMWIHQDAWMFLANFEKGKAKEYRVQNKNNGVYIFIIEGKIQINNQILEKRDGYGISAADSFIIESLEDSEVLLIDVPMQLS
ncbi:MAG TPA: pirin family protein [Perlabentimonas sp.]|nr:pirin family protein [Perlabentimonas sp.]